MCLRVWVCNLFYYYFLKFQFCLSLCMLFKCVIRCLRKHLKKKKNNSNITHYFHTLYLLFLFILLFFLSRSLAQIGNYHFLTLNDLICDWLLLTKTKTKKMKKKNETNKCSNRNATCNWIDKQQQPSNFCILISPICS